MSTSFVKFCISRETTAIFTLLELNYQTNMSLVNNLC